MADMCTDDREEMIEQFKKKLVESTNIETSPEEMKVLENILLRFWQIGWLDSIDRMPLVKESAQMLMHVEGDSVPAKALRNAGQLMQNAIDGEAPEFETITSEQTEDYTELKLEFIRMASYIDVLLKCSDEQKETLLGFISRLAEFMPWRKDDLIRDVSRMEDLIKEVNRMNNLISKLSENHSDCNCLDKKDGYCRVGSNIDRTPSTRSEYKPVTIEDFAKTMSESTTYDFVTWHCEALTLMKERGFVICKRMM